MFWVFNIRTILFEMQEFSYDAQMCNYQPLINRLIPQDFISFWSNVEQFYEDQPNTYKRRFL